MTESDTKEPDALWSSLLANRAKTTAMRATRVGGHVPSGEDDPYYRCSKCGQLVDIRDLFALLHHEQRVHKPLPLHN